MPTSQSICQIVRLRINNWNAWLRAQKMERKLMHWLWWVISHYAPPYLLLSCIILVFGVVTPCKEGALESILSPCSNLGLLGLCPSYEAAISDLFRLWSSSVIMLLILFPGMITSFVFLFLWELEFRVGFEFLLVSLFICLWPILRTTFFVISLAMRNGTPERLTVWVIRCESNFSCRPLDLVT